VKAKKIVVGYNYHFGSNQRGDVEVLKQVCKLFQVDVEVMEPLRIGSTTVSSSKIRELIKDGEVEEASKLLGRNYPVIGKVVPGAKRGQTLGFPTANLEITEELYPKKGVYAVEVVWRQQLLNGLANVGMNPTFLPARAKEGTLPSIEVHILDFHQDLYGEEIQVNFKKRIRDETRFNSPSELMEQIRKDVEWASGMSLTGKNDDPDYGVETLKGGKMPVLLLGYVVGPFVFVPNLLTLNQTGFP
jgi:riboflavin kinase/FMN adenylyltransferase